MDCGAAAFGDAVERIWFIALFLDQPGNSRARNVGCTETWDGWRANATEFASR